MDEGPLVLFDGTCNLCNRAVRFLARRDRCGRLRFASLQSARARELLGESAAASEVPDAVVFAERGAIFTGSEAVLRIASHLSWPWPAVALLGRALPLALRDALYRYVARNRYRWFGRQERCPLPDDDLRARFLG
jgi:predicted DCC family thiol-disulfide oxidoreductase YuxK